MGAFIDDTLEGRIGGMAGGPAEAAATAALDLAGHTVSRAGFEKLDVSSGVARGMCPSERHGADLVTAPSGQRFGTRAVFIECQGFRQDEPRPRAGSSLFSDGFDEPHVMVKAEKLLWQLHRYMQHPARISGATQELGFAFYNSSRSVIAVDMDRLLWAVLDRDTKRDVIDVAPRRQPKLVWWVPVRLFGPSCVDAFAGMQRRFERGEALCAPGR